MPVRFRKTFQLFPGVKVNVSKGGISFTVGTKGYHLNFSDRGVKQTVGIPGSGVSHSTYLSKNDDDTEAETGKEKQTRATKKKRTTKKETDTETPVDARNALVEAQVAARRRTPGWVLLLAIIVIYLGALVLGLIPTNFLSQLLRTLLDLTRSIGL